MKSFIVILFCFVYIDVYGQKISEIETEGFALLISAFHYDYYRYPVTIDELIEDADPYVYSICGTYHGKSPLQRGLRRLKRDKKLYIYTDKCKEYFALLRRGKLVLLGSFKFHKFTDCSESSFFDKSGKLVEDQDSIRSVFSGNLRSLYKSMPPYKRTIDRLRSLRYSKEEGFEVYFGGCQCEAESERALEFKRLAMDFIEKYPHVESVIFLAYL